MYVCHIICIYILQIFRRFQVWLKGVAVTQGAPRTYELYSGAIAAPRAFWCEPPTSCPWPRPVLSHWLVSASTPVWLDLDWRPGANKLPAAVCALALVWWPPYLLGLQFPMAVFQWVASYSQFISCMVIWLLPSVSSWTIAATNSLPHSNDRGGEEQRFVQTFSL